MRSFQAGVAASLSGARPWRVEVVEQSGSTNAELVAKVRQGQAGEYAVLVALDQPSGRGRKSRAWTMPPGEGVAISLVLPLGADSSRWGLVPLAVGVAVVRAVADLGVAARLKWPNDVLVGTRKLCGILAEVADRSVVVGIGVNVLQTAETIFPTGVSLALAGAGATREQVVAAVLNHVADLWVGLAGDDGWGSLLADYRTVCGTLGQQVRVHTDEQTYVEGQAVDIADDGQLLVRTADRLNGFASGDVYHLR